MHGLRVHIQPDMCCGSGNCAAICPAVFRLDYETNRAECIDGAPISAYAVAIARAIEECPTQAISLISPKHPQARRAF